MESNGSKGFQIDPNGSKYLEMAQIATNGSQELHMDLKISKWLHMATKWLHIA